MRRSSRFHLARVAGCLVVAQACTSYGPALTTLDVDDRFRIVADSPFAVTVAGRDRVPTGHCQATRVIGRVLAVRGDTLVVGGSPTIVPAPGTACFIAATAIFVAPPNARQLELRRPDNAKTVWALGATGFLVYVVGQLLRAMFPKT